MRKPAEVIKLMMTLIILGCLVDNRPKSEKGTLRDTHKLNSCSLLAGKNSSKILYSSDKNERKHFFFSRIYKRFITLQ